MCDIREWIGHLKNLRHGKKTSAKSRIKMQHTDLIVAQAGSTLRTTPDIETRHFGLHLKVCDDLGQCRVIVSFCNPTSHNFLPFVPAIL